MKIRWPKFYNSQELLDLKKDLQKRVDKIEKNISKYNNRGEKEDLKNSLEYRTVIQNDLKRVKRVLSRRNFLFNINAFIFGREKINRNLEFFTELSTSTSSKKISLKEIGVDLDALKRKLQNIDKHLQRFNNSLFNKSLLILRSV